VLDALPLKRCRLLINLYAKVYNFMLCYQCATPLLSAGNVSPDEGMRLFAS
jgi:hypothetical protein